MNESLRGPLIATLRQGRHQRRNLVPTFPFWLSAIAGIVLLSAAVGAGTGAGVATLVNNGDSNTSAAVTASSPVVNGRTEWHQGQSPTSQLRPSVVEIQVSSASGAGTGSGVILDTEGHILTNYHVVQGMMRSTSASPTAPSSPPASSARTPVTTSPWSRSTRPA